MAEPATVFLQNMNVLFSSEVFCNTVWGRKKNENLAQITKYVHTERQQW